MRAVSIFRSGLLWVAIAFGPSAWAETARLAAGSHLTLQLMHHITSSETPAGAPVYFRVKSDVLAQSHVVIRKDAIVVGKMEATTERGALGVSGSLNFGVRFVPAIDGQNVRVIANLTSNGRSRDGALIGWTIFWGFPGLITRGVNAYAMRGAELDAEILSDKVIDLGVAPTASPEQPAAASATISVEHHSFGGTKDRSVAIDLERVRKLSPLTFYLGAARAPDATPAQFKLMRLVTVNGMALGEEISATRIDDGAATFDAWSVLKYCDKGENALQFLLTAADDRSWAASYSLPVEITTKAAN